MSARRLVLLHFILLLPLTIFLCFYNLDAGSEWGSYTAVDEGRHIMVAQEMWISGKWWMPTLDRKPYFLKPPFKMWLTMIPAHLLGESNFSYRLIDAFLGVVIATPLLYFFTFALFGSLGAAFFSCLFLLGNQLFFFSHGTRAAVQDTIMLFLTSLAMLYSWRFIKICLERGASVKEGNATGVKIGLLLGFAAFSKSIAAYYPYILWTALTAVTKKLWPIAQKHYRMALIILGISLAVPACFYLPHEIFSRSFFSQAINHEVIQRLGSGIHNVKDRTFYLKVLLHNQLGPAWPICLATFYFLIQGFVRGILPYRFVFIWAVLPFTIYSFLHSRLDWYLAPIYLAVAMMAGVSIHQALLRVMKIIKTGEWKVNPRAAVALLLCVTFVGFTLWQNSISISHAATRVWTRIPRLNSDYLSEDIRHNLPNKWHPGQVIAYKIPRFARAETPYYNMFRAAVRIANDEEKFEKLLKERSPTFILTSLESAELVIKKTSPLKYFVLPPCMVAQGYKGKKRARPMVVFSYNANADLPHFKPVEPNLIKDGELQLDLNPAGYSASLH